MTSLAHKKKTMERILRVIYGRARCYGGTRPYSALSIEERKALLEPHQGEIEKDLEVFVELLSDARKEGIAAAHAHLRKADAFDPEAVDDVMASQLDPDDDATPEHVPRAPFAGGM